MAFIVSIAGSDSSGGAGNQADVSCVEALGHHTLSVITAITAQGLRGVEHIAFCDEQTVQAQIKSIFSSFNLGAVKSGVLPNTVGILTLAHALKTSLKPLPYVLDPVMRASSGARLMHEDSVQAMVHQLIPLASVVTPNIFEAETLTGRTITTIDEMIAAGQDLLEFGCRAVLVKGGHASNDPGVDILLDSRDVAAPHFIRDQYIAGRSPRGTGCTYASAIACGLATHLSLYDAILQAKRFITKAIANAHRLESDVWLLNHRVATSLE